MSKSKLRTKIIFILLTAIIFYSYFASINYVKADYNIAVGDSFSFDITKLRNLTNTSTSISIGAVILAEGLSFTINVTYFELPHIKYVIKAEGSPAEEYALFSEIIFVNRNWDDLTEEYELTGYEVEETSTTWSVRDDRFGILEVDYWKADGVLSKFYANNFTALVDGLGVGEVEIIRDIGSSTNSGAISLLTILPMVFSIFFIATIITKKKA